MTNIWNLVVSGSAGFVGGVVGGTFKWFVPSWEDLKEGRKAKREAKIDKKVLGEMKLLCEGNSGIYGTEDIAERLRMSVDETADSLERLEIIGRVQRYDIGTLDHPGPGWRCKSR
ncbi:MAG TPA: hypothetical protein VMU48_04465 [Terracidiphilus sp.]|nr:hypothetical protein [Terracidiphilus sp.]